MAKATLTFTSTQEPPNVHPAEDNWMQQSFDNKKHQITAGNIAAILVTIKKPHHIKPFVAPESAKTDKDLYRGSATIDTNNPYPVYLLIQKVQDHVFTIMDKKDATTDYKFPFIDQDIRTEIDNLTDPTGNKFKVDNLPPDFPQDLATVQANDDPNKDRIPVLTMIPVTMPIGFGRDPPQGDIQIDITQMAYQNNDPSLPSHLGRRRQLPHY
jgi:hypothetical protein